MTTAISPNTPDWDSVVADNLRAEAARQRWSGRKIADRLGVAPQWVNRRLSGETTVSPADLMLFAEFFGVPVSTFFQTQKTAPTPKGEGRKLPELDSNQQPAGIKPLAPVTRLEPRATQPAERPQLAPVHAISGNR